MLTQAHLSFMKVKVAQSCLTFCDPMDRSIPGFSVLGILQARILKWVAVPFSRGSSQPRDQTQVSCIEGDSLPSEPPGKPKNTRVGSLSLLQEIFPTQVSDQGLLHCRWILTSRTTKEGKAWKLCNQYFVFHLVRKLQKSKS